jgi:hypothetical protein
MNLTSSNEVRVMNSAVGEHEHLYDLVQEREGCGMGKRLITHNELRGIINFRVLDPRVYKELGIEGEQKHVRWYWQLDGIVWSKNYDNHAEHQVISHGNPGLD